MSIWKRREALTQEEQEFVSGCGSEENPPTPLSGVAPSPQLLPQRLTSPPLELKIKETGAVFKSFPAPRVISSSCQEIAAHRVGTSAGQMQAAGRAVKRGGSRDVSVTRPRYCRQNPTAGSKETVELVRPGAIDTRKYK